MAKVLTAKGFAASLEELIRKAEKELHLISYSFIVSDSFMTRIKQAAERGVKIKIVYGKSIDYNAQKELEQISNLEVLHLQNLHAKVYINETKCIIGSMNFSEPSEINNTELGVLLSLANDKDSFSEARNHCNEILKEAEKEKISFPKRSYKPQNPNEKLGYCIRTGARIPLDHTKPLSNDAYSVWNQFGEEYYPENYCHFSGEKSDGGTNYAFPVLSKHWSKYQKELQKVTL